MTNTRQARITKGKIIQRGDIVRWIDYPKFPALTVLKTGKETTEAYYRSKDGNTYKGKFYNNHLRLIQTTQLTIQF